MAVFDGTFGRTLSTVQNQPEGSPNAAGIVLALPVRALCLQATWTGAYLWSCLRWLGLHVGGLASLAIGLDNPVAADDRQAPQVVRFRPCLPLKCSFRAFQRLFAYFAALYVVWHGGSRSVLSVGEHVGTARAKK